MYSYRVLLFYAFFFVADLSVEEIPGEAEAEDGVVLRIVGREELHTISAAGIGMTVNQEEARLAEVHVGLYFHDTAATEIYTALRVLLHCILA